MEEFCGLQGNRSEWRRRRFAGTVGRRKRRFVGFVVAVSVRIRVVGPLSVFVGRSGL